jgi:hypothetical protein
MTRLTSIILRRSLAFIKPSCFGSSIPSCSMLAILHVLEQNILSGLVPRRTVFKQAYPNRPESEFHPSDGRHRRTSEIGLFPLHVRNIIHDLRVDLRFPLLLQDLITVLVELRLVLGDP